MSSKIKKISLAVIILVVGLLFAALFFKDKLKNVAPAGVATEQSISDKFDVASSLEKNVSIKDILSEIDFTVADCGEKCEDGTCREVRACLHEHALDCSSAKGKIAYSISGSDNKKYIEQIIVGEEGENCVLRGLKVGVNDGIEAKTPYTFQCKVPKDKLSIIFVDTYFDQFISDYCSGTYVDFLKSKKNTIPADKGASN